MMIRVAASMLLCAAVSAAQAQGGCSKGSEFEPPLCPLDPSAIRQIVVTENAAKSPADEPVVLFCARCKFRPFAW
ncbi:MAG: hypothetical protein ABJA77_17495 [Variovorax sp.]